MQKLASIIATLAWALWFGAVIALFIFVLTLFHHNREIAVQAAPQLFDAFEKYHLILAGVALLATAIWQFAAPSKLVIANLILLLLATACGVVLAVWFVGPMDALRERGLSGSEEFKRLHGESMIFFLGESITLFIYGVILPFAMRGDAGRSRGTAAEKGSPA